MVSAFILKLSNRSGLLFSKCLERLPFAISAMIFAQIHDLNKRTLSSVFGIRCYMLFLVVVIPTDVLPHRYEMVLLWLVRFIRNQCLFWVLNIWRIIGLYVAAFEILLNGSE